MTQEKTLQIFINSSQNWQRTLSSLTSLNHPASFQVFFALHQEAYSCGHIMMYESFSVFTLFLFSIIIGIFFSRGSLCNVTFFVVDNCDKFDLCGTSTEQ